MQPLQDMYVANGAEVLLPGSVSDGHHLAQAQARCTHDVLFRQNCQQASAHPAAAEPLFACHCYPSQVAKVIVSRSWTAMVATATHCSTHHNTKTVGTDTNTQHHICHCPYGFIIRKQLSEQSVEDQSSVQMYYKCGARLRMYNEQPWAGNNVQEAAQ